MLSHPPTAGLRRLAGARPPGLVLHAPGGPRPGPIMSVPPGTIGSAPSEASPMTAKPPVPTPARWEFWIDRGGTFTDVVARRPDGTLADAQALVRESRALSRRRRARHSRAPGAAARHADPARPCRRRENGDHRRDQRAARAQRRAHGARHHARASPMRCASPTRIGPSSSCGGSSCRRCCTSA